MDGDIKEQVGRCIRVQFLGTVLENTGMIVSRIMRRTSKAVYQQVGAVLGGTFMARHRTEIRAQAREEHNGR
jgi:hypothetical protein